jgi:hypothetical protein
MTTILEVKQVIIANTPLGDAQVLFIIDYGIHQNTIWVCASFKDGIIKHFDSNQISIKSNHTINFNINNQ